MSEAEFPVVSVACWQMKCTVCSAMASTVCVCVSAVHVEDIIFHMFQYIQKLRTEGPQEWVFEECKVIKRSGLGKS